AAHGVPAVAAGAADGGGVGDGVLLQHAGLVRVLLADVGLLLLLDVVQVVVQAGGQVLVQVADDVLEVEAGAHDGAPWVVPGRAARGGFPLFSEPGGGSGDESNVDATTASAIRTAP